MCGNSEIERQEFNNHTNRAYTHFFDNGKIKRKYRMTIIRRSFPLHKEIKTIKIDWDAEAKKCEEDEWYYYYNYLIIKGQEDEPKLSREEYYKKKEELLKLAKQRRRGR